MANGTADINVHIDETLDHERLRVVAERIRKSFGIASVESHEKQPHFLLVRYDPSKVSSGEIHRLVTAEGVHAEVIGL